MGRLQSIVVLVVLCFGLGGCGFQLKRDTNVSSMMGASIAVVAPDFLLFSRLELERQLALAGANLAASTPELTVYLIEENISRRALTRDDNGRPTEFELRIKLNYRVNLKQSSLTSTPEAVEVGADKQQDNEVYTLTRTGAFIYNNRLLLAAEAREREVIKQLREQLVSDLIVNLSQMIKA